MITIKALRPGDIDFLQRANALYSVDFRAIGESFDMEIIDMWKYENLMPWVVSDKHASSNELSKLLKYDNTNVLIEVPMAEKATKSVFERLSSKQLPAGINELWTAIPHPEADRLCAEKNLKINYSYADFLKFNDKIHQKELFGDQTPKWNKVSEADLDGGYLERNVYFKRQFGSGGYTLHRSAEFSDVEGMKGKLFEDGTSLWFAEDTVKGTPSSIQVAKSASLGTVIFGYSQQKIIDNKHFAGSDMMGVGLLTPEMIAQLESALEKLNGLLADYEGFFGIDFMLDGSKIHILEANVRLTAATIPTLIMNEHGRDRAEYFEDYAIGDVTENDVVIGMHPDKDKGDIVRLLS